MAEIEKKKLLTDAEKAAWAEKEQKTEKKDESTEREKQQTALEEKIQREKEVAEAAARTWLDTVNRDIPPETITDSTMLGDILSMKIRDFPKHIPAYLDLIVEKNPKLLDSPGVSTLLAAKIQELLNTISQKPELSRDRDWMESLRASINHLIINPDIQKKLNSYGTMDENMRVELQKNLSISPEITQGLDENTRDIVQKVHTGFYRFDPGVNTWVNSVGALVFLWPENIAGIKKYLTEMHPDHPFLSVTNYHSHDKEGKYAISFGGTPHNMMLAESDYLVQYLTQRAQGKDDNTILAELGKSHVANLKTNAEVTKSIKEFENKYGEGSFSAAKKQELYEQSRIVSRSLLSPREQKEVSTEQYELVLDKRPEMRDIIADIVGGFIRFNRHTHSFQTITNIELRFTEEEFQMINNIFEKTHPDYMFLQDKQIPTYPRDSRRKNQYTPKILQDRIHFYQQ